MVGILPSEAVDIAIRYMEVYLPEFELIENGNSGPYWWVKFVNDDVKIHITGDRGFYIEIIIDGTSYDLWRFDRKVSLANETTKANLMLHLEVVREFFR